MEKARCNTELYSNLRGPLNNVKPSNFWGSHQFRRSLFLSAGKKNVEIKKFAKKNIYLHNIVTIIYCNHL